VLWRLTTASTGLAELMNWLKSESKKKEAEYV